VNGTNRIKKICKLKLEIIGKIKKNPLITMKNKLKLTLGIIFCLLGVIILISTFVYAKLIPGGFISLAVGILLISESRKN
jgi:hypothetical protein